MTLFRTPAPIKMRHGTDRSYAAAALWKAVLIIVGLVALGAAIGAGAAGVVLAEKAQSAQTSPSVPSGMRNPQSGGLGMPTDGWVTTYCVEPISYENGGYYYDPSNTLQYADYLFHHGIDVSNGCTAGVYPVYASASGTVAVAQYINDGYGSQVIIDHGYDVGGNGRYTYTFYSHMGNRSNGASYIFVTPGQWVDAGQLIGYQGDDGAVFGSCTPDPGTHLDWEIRLSSAPLTYGTQMRYNATAASPNYYTYQQVTYGDAVPVSQVTAGPFHGGPPPATNTPVPVPTSPPPPQPSPTSQPTDTPIPQPTWTPGPCGMRFTDIPDNFWCYLQISYLYCHGIISGYSDGTFGPGNNTTRAQFAKMIVLGMGWTLYNPYFPTFSDVAPGSTYYQYIETANLRNISTGYPDGTFKPNQPITRAQTAKMIVVAKGWDPVYLPYPTFFDVLPGYWAFGYITTAYQHGIISGYGDGYFRPDRNVNRAQLSKMLTFALTYTSGATKR